MKISKEHSSLSITDFENLIAGKYKQLTQEEVDQLPDGCPVIVIWSGDNGPHLYRTLRTGYGQVYVQRRDSLLTYVGKHPLNQVWLKSEV